MNEEMNLYRIPKTRVQNILTFLDRVRSYEGGIKDACEMAAIVETLKNPIIDSAKDNQNSLREETIKEKLDKRSELK